MLNFSGVLNFSTLWPGIAESEDNVSIVLSGVMHALGVSFPGGASGKNPPADAGDIGSIPGRSPAEGNDNLFQYSCPGNSMGRGAWWTTVHGVTESDMTE